MAAPRVEVDGGLLEGGGQILRVSTALSCLLGLPLRVQKIRAGRSTPGLRPQHLSGLEMIRDLCAGQLEGADIGSTEITFTPGKIQGGSHTADTKTAGSVCLLLQVSLPCVLFAASPSELRLRGGTNAEMAPQIDYTAMVFKPIAEKFGFKFNCDIKMRGYYPKGGGEVIVQVSPVKQLNPINITERGSVTKISGRAFVAGACHLKCEGDGGGGREVPPEGVRDLYVNIQPVQEPRDLAFGNGSGIIIVAETSTGCLLAGSALGKRGVNADKVGIDAAEMLLANLRHGGAVDEYLQDQVATSGTRSEPVGFERLVVALSVHFNTDFQTPTGVAQLPDHFHGTGQRGFPNENGTRDPPHQTAIHFAEQLAKAKFTVKKSEEEGDASKDAYIIECHGVAMTNPHL
ncbi:hypothetical protein QTO34_011027 [Cnephaeus nilssonii]|uniref:RNA 3'-terminal phosphate cyclase n=1 Tax=Cnephaeus nilssonii TaxID=3371016 RepID=A0AA40HDI7_CNENI|nr:hypothetical protein QTO34_011027 [Eptesicus nilssonii]